VALNNVQEAVLNTARREASLIVQRAQKAAEEHKQQALQAARAEVDHAFARQSRLIQEELSQKLLQRQSQGRREVLEKQNATLVRVFAFVRDQYLQWPKEQKQRAAVQLLQRAAEEQPGQIRVHPSEQDVYEAALAEINAERPGHLTLDTEHPLDAPGGFIYVCPDYEVDCTLETVLQGLQREWAPRVAAKLFAGGGA